MGRLDIFDNKPGTYKTYVSKEPLEKDIKEVNKLIQGDLNLKTTDRLVFLLERSAVSLRGAMEHCEKEDNLNSFIRENFDKNEFGSVNKFDENLPVKVEEKDGNIHIFTPYLFKRGMKESFVLASYLNAELQKEGNKQLIESVSNDKKVVIVVRISNKFNRAKHKDNDNLEVSEFLNVMCQNLSLSDNAIHMSFFSDFIVSNDKNIQGLHFFLVSYNEKDFRGKTWIDYFRK